MTFQQLTEFSQTLSSSTLVMVPLIPSCQMRYHDSCPYDCEVLGLQSAFNRGKVGGVFLDPLRVPVWV